MRIALLSEKFAPDPGGLAVSAGRLAASLAAAGHEVDVYAPTAALAPGTVTHEQEGGVRLRRIGVSRRTDDHLANWFAALIDAHEARPYDLFQAYYLLQAGFVAAYAGQYTGTPSIVGARGSDLDRSVLEPSKAAHILYALQHAHAVTANSRELVRKAQALAPGRTVHLIPNGVNLEVFAPGPRDEALAEALGLAGRLTLGFVGEACAKKGLATLLRAQAILARRYALEPALLLIGGICEADKDSLHEFQQRNPGLLSKVVPYVATEALPAYYGLLDVLVHPTLRDGLPNAVLEGMACGRAVVASAVGGLPDVIRDGENGCLVPPGDAHALAAAMAGLLTDPTKRERLGQAARATIVRDFSPERELALNLALYQSLV